MREPWIQKVRAFLHQPIPRRRYSSLGWWWEWRCRMYRVHPHDPRSSARSRDDG